MPTFGSFSPLFRAGIGVLKLIGFIVFRVNNAKCIIPQRNNNWILRRLVYFYVRMSHAVWICQRFQMLKNVVLFLFRNGYLWNTRNCKYKNKCRFDGNFINEIKLLNSFRIYEFITHRYHFVMQLFSFGQFFQSFAIVKKCLVVLIPISFFH